MQSDQIPVLKARICVGSSELALGFTSLNFIVRSYSLPISYIKIPTVAPKPMLLFYVLKALLSPAFYIYVLPSRFDWRVSAGLRAKSKIDDIKII